MSSGEVPVDPFTMDSLIDYCCSQPGLIVVPIELLSESGLDSEAALAYQERGMLTRSECQRIDAMIVAYCKRAGVLGKASRQWFPARVQHLCLITNGVRTRPYFQPFHRSSWLLYRDDVAESSSSFELSVFLLFQAERQFLQQQIGASLLSNLGYLLILSETQLHDLCTGCQRSTRPDAAGYRALAEAITIVRGLHHEQFRPPKQVRPDHRRLPDGLIVTPDQQQLLHELHQEWMASLQSVVASHRSSSHAPTERSGQTLRAWLETEAPHLVLTGKRAEPLWQGPGTACGDLDTLLAQLSPEAEESILEDLKVIDRKSRLFLDALSAPEELARPASWMTEGGLSFIHGPSRRIAYSLTDDPNRLWQVTPPYERLMLAARTIHEWGHQAAESGWVRVAPERCEQRRLCEQQLIELLDSIVEQLPGAMKPTLVAALDTTLDSSNTPGQYLLRVLLRRIDDYMANLVARHFLTRDEMDTYVRNNVGSRLLDHAPEQALIHLLRVAYEYQYLSLSSVRNPKDWFVKSTWFEALFLTPGILSMASFEQLTAQIGRICDCYEIDADRIKVPMPGG